MIQTLFSAATAMTSHQMNIDVIANNVSNVNTNGFKRSRVDFKETLYSRMHSPVDNTPPMNLQLGHGALVYRTHGIFDEGVTIVTNQPTDMAIEGSGFFTVAMQDGSIGYTRRGDFKLSNEEDGLYLVDAKGNYVLDINGERINVGDASGMSVDTDGTIRLADEDGVIDMEAPAQRLAIVDFTNPPGLLAIGDGYYAEADNSGPPLEAQDYKVRQSALESSNVDIAEEVTRLIRAQRAYQMMSRAITTADRMAEIANSIRT